jgi:sugar phosphate isomerase/epimerase
MPVSNDVKGVWMNLDLAVQSYCFRTIKDNRQVAACVGACGVDGIELCVAHVDLADERSWDEVIGAYRDAGVRIVSFGVARMGRDADLARRAFAFAAAAGAGHISVDFPVDAVPACYEVAGRLAGEYGVRLGLHNHGGRHWLGHPDVVGQALAAAPERVGLCLDSGWALDSWTDPVAWVERFRQRLYAVHFKDFVYERVRKPVDVVTGEGNLDLGAFCRALAAAGFSGPALVEYEGDPDDPVPAVTRCVQAVRAAVAGV